MRQALESSHTTSNLHLWIDLIFGYKQSGRPALESINCYHPACYFGYPVDEISDTVRRKAIETMIKTWGQTPKQLFTTPHLPTFRKSPQTLHSHKFKDSVHSRILNVKWGSYVGSLDQALPPVCVYKESCKRNIVNLVAINSNEIVGLAQNKCLLLNETSSPTDTTRFMAVIEWGFNDDFIKARLEANDKQSSSTSNLLAIRANENIITTCCCIGSKYLVVGKPE